MSRLLMPLKIYIMYNVGDAIFKAIYNIVADRYYVYKWIYSVQHNLDICEYSF